MVFSRLTITAKSSLKHFDLSHTVYIIHPIVHDDTLFLPSVPPSGPIRAPPSGPTPAGPTPARPHGPRSHGPQPWAPPPSTAPGPRPVGEGGRGTWLASCIPAGGASQRPRSLFSARRSSSQDRPARNLSAIAAPARPAAEPAMARRLAAASVRTCLHDARARARDHHLGKEGEVKGRRGEGKAVARWHRPPTSRPPTSPRPRPRLRLFALWLRLFALSGTNAWDLKGRRGEGKAR